MFRVIRWQQWACGTSGEGGHYRGGLAAAFAWLIAAGLMVITIIGLSPAAT
jgi:hypothetical protein